MQVNNMPNDLDPRWITIKPSMVNLALTLAGGVIAAGVLLVIDMPDWLRLSALVAIPLVLVCESWLILQKSAATIVAFRLEPFAETPDDLVLAHDDDGKATKSREKPALTIRLRTRAQHAAGTGEAVGIVMKQSYVSHFFTSILYRLERDPAWRGWFPRALALWPDAVDKKLCREVRVLLKWR